MKRYKTLAGVHQDSMFPSSLLFFCVCVCTRRFMRISISFIFSVAAFIIETIKEERIDVVVEC